MQAGFKKRLEAITRAKGVAATVLCLSRRGPFFRVSGTDVSGRTGARAAKRKNAAHLCHFTIAFSGIVAYL